jgi:diguanylate cyclase (GGDEF)-like protein/putative nucleotidyltransferase with HDIG domain
VSKKRKDHQVNPATAPEGVANSSFPGQEIDAVRRHICHILGFDVALIDIIRGTEISNVITFLSEESDAEEETVFHQFIDENKESIALPDSQIAKRVKEQYTPYVGRVFNANDKDDDAGMPYVVVPIADGLDDKNIHIKGLLRVLSLDSTREIEPNDVQTLKLVGQHLASRLPQLAAAQSQRVEAEGTDDGASVTEPVLVVLSNRVVRRRFSRTLSPGYTVLETDDAQKAIDLLKESPVSLVVMDSELQGPGGQPLVKTIKDSPQWKHLPMVLVVPEADPGKKIEALNAGADDCILDNCIDAELLAKVKALLRLRKTERELATQLQLLENYAQRLEQHSEQERQASLKVSKEKHQLDETVAQLNQKKREAEIRRNQDLLLRRISDTIRKSFNIEDNIGEMLESLAGWLELDCCFVVLPEVDESQEAIRKEFSTGPSYALQEKELDLRILEIFKSSFRSDEMVLVNDVKRDKRIEPFKKDVLSHFHLYSVFYVPITYEEKLLGVLGGHKCESEAHWSPDNESFLIQVADQLAIGVTNARLYKRVERQAISDGLTNLFNHRTGQEKLAEQLKLAERYQKNLSVILMDVDHFKSVNDTYGHPAGDSVLRSVAKIVRRDCRDVDIPVRYGGEEFLLVLPEINQEGAVIVAERLRKTLSREVIMHDDVQLSVTASLGVASYPEDAETQHNLLELADKALYMSKRLGRNQVHTASDLMFNELEEQHPEQPVATPVVQGTGENEEGLVPEVVEMVKAMAGALYAKSEYNKVHHLETARFAEMTAKVLGLNQRQVEQIRVAGLLHDVGLLSVPEDIINKPGQVTADELRVLMQHPLLGAQMFRPIHALKEICDILENHHECWDGTGYPRGLKGEEIPLAARIIAIVDSYHAMISDRPYRPAMSRDKAKRVLRNGAGTQFDPFLVDIFIAVLTEVEEAEQAQS